MVLQRMFRGKSTGPAVTADPASFSCTRPTDSAGATSCFRPGSLSRICASRLRFSRRPSSVSCLRSAGCRARVRFGSRSDWAAVNSTATAAPFFEPSTWSFGDVETSFGSVQTQPNGFVVTQPPLLGPSPVVAQPGLPSITACGGASLRMDAAPLVGTPSQVVLENTGLLLHAVLELSEIGNPSNFLRYDVTAVRYDANASTLELAVDPNGPTLASFAPPGGAQAALIPSFFRVSTDGTLDFLASSASVRIGFQATTAGPNGLPDESQAVPLPFEFTANPALLNASPLNRDLRFFRFQVSFDVDAIATGVLGVGTPLPSLEFLRVPFQY